jgi:hypothetical protein
MKTCLFCEHHETLNVGRIGDILCRNPNGQPKIRPTIMREGDISLDRFNVKDLEIGACHVYKTSET